MTEEAHNFCIQKLRTIGLEKPCKLFQFCMRKYGAIIVQG